MELNIEAISDDIIWTDLKASQRDKKPATISHVKNQYI